MNTEEITEPIDAPETRAAAFLAPPFHWKDIELKPLSIGREGDWLNHCRRIGLPPLHEAINSGESFLAHAQRMLFFLAHEPRVWLAIWMKGGPGAPILLESLIDDWSAKHIGPGDQIDLIKTALTIYDRSRATQAILVEEEPDDDSGNGHGPRAERSTSASSRGPAPALEVLNTSNTNSPRKKAGRSFIPTAAPKAASTSGLKKATKKRHISARPSRDGVRR